jgi:hypothetical protein
VEGTDERNRSLIGPMAPDFILPDLIGVPHRLQELRGRKEPVMAAIAAGKDICCE